MTEAWLEDVHAQFMNMCPVDLIYSVKIDCLKNSSANWQKEILSATVHHPLAIKYPPSNKFIKRFLKTLIQTIEANDLEVDEEVYSCYLNLLSCENEETGETCFKTYYSKRYNLRIILEENINLLSNGTTGLRTWEAAIYLTEWCLQNKKLLNGKRILELGSGIGFTGIAIVKSSHPSLYCFTDAHERVLEQLEKNLAINIRDSCLDCVATRDSKPLSETNLSDCVTEEKSNPSTRIKKLDWTKITRQEEVYDIILAADVVFNPDINPDLVKTLANLLGPLSSAYIACTVRNEKTIEHFHSLLEHSGVSSELITEHVDRAFDYINISSVKMWKLHRTI